MEVEDIFIVFERIASLRNRINGYLLDQRSDKNFQLYRDFIVLLSDIKNMKQDCLEKNISGLDRSKLFCTFEICEELLAVISSELPK